MDNALSILKKPWDERARRFGKALLHKSAISVKLFPMPLSGLGGWHPDLHRAMGSIAASIASRALFSVDYAWGMQELPSSAHARLTCDVV